MAPSSERTVATCSPSLSLYSAVVRPDASRPSCGTHTHARTHTIPHSARLVANPMHAWHTRSRTRRTRYSCLPNKRVRAATMDDMAGGSAKRREQTCWRGCVGNCETEKQRSLCHHLREPSPPTAKPRPGNSVPARSVWQYFSRATRSPCLFTLDLALCGGLLPSEATVVEFTAWDT